MFSPYQVVRPFIWVALAAFLLGFAAFLVLGGGALAGGLPEPGATPVATPQYYPDAGPVRIV